MTTEEAVESIDVSRAKDLLDAEAVAIDTRPPGDWAGAHVPNALNLPLLAIASRFREVPEEKALLFFSEDGVRSVQAAAKAKSLGFKEVYNVEGGVKAWIAAGLPTEALM